MSICLQHWAPDRQYVSDCEGCETAPQKIEVINRTVTLEGDLSEENTRRLLQIADRCPVHQTLHGDLNIQTQLA